MNIVEIKKMVEEAVPSLENDTELRYLLSVIEAVTETLEQIKYEYEQLEGTNEFRMYDLTKEALQAIRGN